MKKNVFILVLVVLLAIPLSAYAKTYADETGGFSIEIPEDANTYYYTPTDTNMTGTLLESAQSGEEMTRLLIGSYNEDNILGYSLKLEVKPLDAQAGDPLTAELELVRSAQAEEYTFSEIGSTEIGGKQAKMLEGPSTKDPSYSTRIIALENEGNVIVETVIYKNDDAAYLQQAETVLSTMAFGALPTATTAPPSQAATATARPTQEPVETTETSQSSSQLINPDTLQPAPEATNTNSENIWMANTVAGLPLFAVVAILAAMVAVIVILIVVLTKRRKKRKQTQPKDAKTRVQRHKRMKGEGQAGKKKGARFK